MSGSRRGLFKALAQQAAQQAAERIPDAEPSAPPAAGPLSDGEVARYERQLALDGWGSDQQVRLRDASVLVVGAGALGSPVATYLAGAGVGRVGVVDDDVVELSNLHRQHLHFTPDLGQPKAHSAVAKLQFLNPDVAIEPYQVRVDEENADGLVAGHDLVVDCSDSFATRYAINAACVSAGIDLVEGGVAGWQGLVMGIRPRMSACYRCAFPDTPADAPTCASAGVLGPAAGIVGSLQALEALKLLAHLDDPLLDAFLQLDLRTGDVLRVATQRRDSCPDCGD